MSGNDDALVSVQGLQKHFTLYRGILGRAVGTVRAVDGVTLTIRRGDTLGLVGESGSGKSTLGRTLIRLYEPTGGRILFHDRDITHQSGRELRQIRRGMQMIFQDPFASMNPRMTVEKIIAEPLVVHRAGTRGWIKDQVAVLLERVGLKPDCMGRFPHEFSGGQRQRFAVARALALEPDFIVCDEPVSSLDVSIRAQIINLLVALQRDLGLTYLFISHDLAVVRHIASQVAVMYLGRVVEVADRRSIYAGPRHPYTQALLQAIPIPDPRVEKSRERKELQGDIPNPSAPPRGCRFHTRCPIVQRGLCDQVEPEFREIGPNHWVACHAA
mgnify:CR=1 FL=1